jgi:outer membrane protein assembly factor BamA
MYAQTWRVQARQNASTPYKTVLEKDLRDSLAYRTWLQTYKQTQIDKGYLELKTDSATSPYETRLTLGTRHVWERLGRGNVPIRIDYRQGEAFSTRRIEAQKQKILQYAENNGHPFAQVRIDSLQMHEGKWRGVWAYEPRVLVTFDSVAIIGKLKTSPKFLMQYLRLQRKQLYSQQKIDAIPTRLQRLPYLRLQGKPEVRFLQDKAFVLLKLSPIKANQIDGILGVLPNENQRGQVLLTGELNGQFYNIFAQGHSLKLQWQRLQSLSQRLEIGTSFQTLFNTPLQLQGDFKSLRQDSSFVNQSWEARLGYATQGNAEFFAQLLRQKSNLGDASNLFDVTKLANVSETLWQGYGIGYKTQTTDDIFFPRKGVQVHFSIYTGSKQVIKNPFLPDSLYKDISLKTPQTLTKLEAQSFHAVGKGVFRLGVQGAYLANKQLFLNELMRIGGLTSLRGHNQNVFFASQYLIGTIEYRLPLGAESYVFAFYDQAYYESRVIGAFLADSPAGLGVGANLSLKAGIFSLAYALGQAKETPFSFSRAKIHFGVVSKF